MSGGGADPTVAFAGPEFESLLEHLRETRGFDFTGYKRSSLTRRIEHRMAQVGVRTHAEYQDHLELHAEEFTALFNTILINVTTFFRDPEAWEYLTTEVLPAIIAAKGPQEPLRVWSAGCASGEEAYTLAIVLVELLGVETFRNRVKIYATDVDEESLAQARQATYDERAVRGVPPELLDRYFEQVGARYVFRKDLRRSVIFGRNDLVQDAPISRIDLLICRNTLMYFTAETQTRVLARFHFALNPAGSLFLGKAEMLLGHGALFRPSDLKRRVFRKVPRLLPPGPAYPVDLPTAPRAWPTVLDRLREETLLAGLVAQVVLTADGLVALVNHQAESLLGISARDKGRPFRDLELAYRPLELRRHIEQAQVERRTVRIGGVLLARGGDAVTVDVQINPLVDDDTTVLGVTVAFLDVTEAKRLQDELQHANLQLETAYEELQSTNEELETTNEELQSTVEELETTNEELQSTNEELETMNEELQSTNDELHTINDELNDRSGQLDEANGFLQAILSSLRAGVVVLGADLSVRVWNSHAEELWGLRHDETVSRPFLTLDIGLPIERILPMIRRALAGESGPHEVGVPAVNRRGRPIDLRVLGSALPGHDDRPAGVILLMEHDERSERDGADGRPVDRLPGIPFPIEGTVPAGIGSDGDGHDGHDGVSAGHDGHGR